MHAELQRIFEEFSSEQIRETEFADVDGDWSVLVVASRRARDGERDGDIREMPIPRYLAWWSVSATAGTLAGGATTCLALVLPRGGGPLLDRQRAAKADPWMSHLAVTSGHLPERVRDALLRCEGVAEAHAEYERADRDYAAWRASARALETVSREAS